MKDCPAHPSIFTRRPLTDTRDLVPLKDFFPTGTMFTTPGLRSILICCSAVRPRNIGKMVPEMNGIPMPGVMPRVEID